MEQDFPFPYTPRPAQGEIVSCIYEALQKGGHLVLESGTGTGKTVCALAPAVRFAKESGKRVLYLTRTNSQQRQVILELRAINEKQQVYGAGIYGRSHMCILAGDSKEFRGGTPEELSRLCSDRKKKVLSAIRSDGAPDACVPYANICLGDVEPLKDRAKREVPTVEELIELCANFHLCPYEFNKMLLPDATVVAAPYIFFIQPHIRRSLLDWMDATLDDLMVIVDEAHNLPDYARSLASDELSINTLLMAAKEVEEFADIGRELEGVAINELISSMEEIVEAIAREYVTGEDGLVPPGELTTELLPRLGISTVKLDKIIEGLITYGQTVRDRKMARGKLPRSHVHSLGRFLFFWFNLDDERYVRLAYGGANPRIEGSCLDPAVATDVFNSCHASVHMSGTLSPLNEYRDSVGLPEESTLRSFPSPFPPENRKLFYASNVTTRYDSVSRDDTIIPRMQRYVTELAGEMEGKNMAVFFPSFALLERFVKEGVPRKYPGKLFRETRGEAQEKLMGLVRDFKASGNGKGKGATLFSVMGGRLSEGIDYPGKELEVVVLAGIPYPRPTAKQRALERYYDIKFGKGWEYTVKAPTARRILQTIGRLIRTESDRGVAIILDSRARQFADFLDGLTMCADPVVDTRKFFRE